MTVRFYTLGCKLNFAETSTFQRQFLSAGFSLAGRSESADVVVVNTCSVTAEADKKCRNIIRRLIGENPSALVVVCGCYASLSETEIYKIEGVSLVIPNVRKSILVSRTLELLRDRNGGESVLYDRDSIALSEKQTQEETRSDYFNAYSSSDRTRSFLKVQDGCSYRCSYCTIPTARGFSRNVSISRIVDDARAIAALGQKEIVLTGVNIGDFGKSTGESFLDLLKELDRVDGIERYRISSIEPNLLTDEIIEFTAGSRKFMPHFHIPLQSGSNDVLRLMRRRYLREKFADRILKVREYMPDAFFGVDVIVGFPSETEENFQETYDFLSGLEPSFLHVFPFSARPGTPAYDMKSVVTPQQKECRVQRLTSLSAALHSRFLSRFVGETRPVLFESNNKNGMMSGYTDNYLRVETKYDRSKVGYIISTVLSLLSSDSQSIVSI